ncbi:MAG: hypothetical protein WAT20_02260 [Ferruginibacter sp.]
MGLFNLSNKSQPASGPYHDSATNLMYNLLFCDDVDLFKTNTKPPHPYPFDILFTADATAADLQKITEDHTAEPRIRLLACNLLLAKGGHPHKELLAVIVEVALDDGLDVLASFKDGTARYINYTGKMIIWENTTDVKANELKDDLFAKSEEVIKLIGPWDQPRKPPPAKGNVRLSFLLSDGLYFGEGPIQVLFNDPMASAPLNSATLLMQYVMQQTKQP